jgi:hypothetical protein
MITVARWMIVRKIARSESAGPSADGRRRRLEQQEAASLQREAV